MKNKKQKYRSPRVEKIQIDRNISIQMQSTTPPPDPFSIKTKDSGGDNPFK